jgi:hypothetical protein
MFSVSMMPDAGDRHAYICLWRSRKGSGSGGKEREVLKPPEASGKPGGGWRKGRSVTVAGMKMD